MKQGIEKINPETEELIAIPIKEYERLKHIEGEYLALLEKQKTESFSEISMAEQQMKLRSIIGQIGHSEDLGLLPSFYSML